MEEKTFKLEIVTPRRVVFSGEVVSFSAPGVIGGFQVLYNHAPMVAAIGVGEVKVRDAHARELRYATSGGFVDVLSNRVTLLAETVETAEEIDIARAESAKDRAAKRLTTRAKEDDARRAADSQERAANRLRIARRG